MHDIMTELRNLQKLGSLAGVVLISIVEMILSCQR